MKQMQPQNPIKEFSIKQQLNFRTERPHVELCSLCFVWWWWGWGCWCWCWWRWR